MCADVYGVYHIPQNENVLPMTVSSLSMYLLTPSAPE